MASTESRREAWAATDYRVRLARGGYASIRCALPLPPSLRALLEHPGDPWGYITAWNPGGVRLACNANRARQRVLRDALRTNHQRAFAGIGVGRDWREPSLFVAGIRFAQLDALARRFGQLAVIRGIGAGPAQLHELD